MGVLGDSIFDSGLGHFAANSEKLHICSAEPANYAGVSGVSLGEKSSPTVSSPADRSGGGREVTVSAISDGSVTGTGTATHWAIVDDTGTELLAAGVLSASQGVTSGNTFTLTAFTIGIPDPA